MITSPQCPTENNVRQVVEAAPKRRKQLATNRAAAAENLAQNNNPSGVGHGGNHPKTRCRNLSPRAEPSAAGWVVLCCSSVSHSFLVVIPTRVHLILVHLPELSRSISSGTTTTYSVAVSLPLPAALPCLACLPAESKVSEVYFFYYCAKFNRLPSLLLSVFLLFLSLVRVCESEMVHITNQLFDKSRYCDFYDKYELLQ